MNSIQTFFSEKVTYFREQLQNSSFDNFKQTFTGNGYLNLDENSIILPAPPSNMFFDDEFDELELESNLSYTSEESFDSSCEIECDGYLLLKKLIKNINDIFIENCKFYDTRILEVISSGDYEMKNIILLVVGSKNHLAENSESNKLLEDDSLLKFIVVYNKGYQSILINYIHINNKYIVNVTECEATYPMINGHTYFIPKILRECYFNIDGSETDDFTDIFKSVKQYPFALLLEDLFNKMADEISSHLDIIYKTYDEKDEIIENTKQSLYDMIGVFKRSWIERFKNSFFSKKDRSDKLNYIINDVGRIIDTVKTSVLTDMLSKGTFFDSWRFSEYIDKNVILSIKSNIVSYIRELSSVDNNDSMHEICLNLDDINNYDFD
jgi:hypothetical protein